MLEWVTSIENYFNQLGTSINDLVNNLNYLIENLNSFMTLMTIYVFVSGTILILLIFLLGKAISNINKLERKIDFIVKYYEEEQDE